jgi:hypothetical protein
LIIFTQEQLLKARKLLKRKDIKLNFLINQKAYFLVKNYQVIIDLKNKKCSCTCNYFVLKKKICSHVLASLLYLFGEVKNLYQFLKNCK